MITCFVLCASFYPYLFALQAQCSHNLVMVPVPKKLLYEYFFLILGHLAVDILKHFSPEQFPAVHVLQAKIPADIVHAVFVFQRLQRHLVTG